MESKIENLFLDFSDFVEKHMIATNKRKNELLITFVFKTYELIDKDLDFDEDYYLNMIRTFQKMVETECKILVETQFCSASISCFKLVMRGDIQLEYETHLDKTARTNTVF